MNHTIYVHPAIQVRKVADYKSIQANQPIPSGTLILIEHAFTATDETCRMVVANNQSLYDDLYPRTFKWSETLPSDRIEIAQSKLERNAFQSPIEGNESLMVIGQHLSKFNHRCHPNAVVTLLARVACAPYLPDFYVYYYGVFVIEDLQIGDEIFISYGAMAGHEIGDSQWPFKCDCQMSQLDRETLARHLVSEGEIFRMNLHSFAKDRIRDYEASSVCYETITNQFLAEQGYSNGYLTPLFKARIENESQWPGTDLPAKVNSYIKSLLGLFSF